MWLPIGPSPWRIALANVVAAALAAQFAFAAIETTVVRIVGERSWKTLAASLGGAWLVALAPGFWLQAVRPEVYAVQALLGAISSSVSLPSRPLGLREILRRF